MFLCSLEPNLAGGIVFGFWILNREIAAHHSACAPYGQRPKQGVVSRCRITGKMCRNIQALVNTVVLTPASCPTGVCGHGKTILGSGVNSL